MAALTGFHALPLSAVSAPPLRDEGFTTAKLTDPALSLLTDLSHAPCVMADHLDGLDSTIHTMVRAHVHMAFVTGVDEQVVGMITTDDLQGERPMQRAQADHVRFQDLTLEQLMTPVSQWQVLTSAQVAHARIGDIVSTLREHGLRYLLVVNPGEPRPVLHGIFSARRLETALGMDLRSDLHARSFAELESLIGH
jgi:CBS domain containing-hemolysin-like protein